MLAILRAGSCVASVELGALNLSTEGSQGMGNRTKPEARDWTAATPCSSSLPQPQQPSLNLSGSQGLGVTGTPWHLFAAVQRPLRLGVADSQSHVVNDQVKVCSPHARSPADVPRLCPDDEGRRPCPVWAGGRRRANLPGAVAVSRSARLVEVGGPRGRSARGLSVSKLLWS